jgi:hypothetical protein
MHAGVSSRLAGLPAALRSVAPLAARATLTLCRSGGGGGSTIRRAAPLLRGARRTLAAALHAGGLTGAATPPGATLFPRRTLLSFASLVAAGAAAILSPCGAAAAAAERSVAPASSAAAAVQPPELAPSLCALKLRALEGEVGARQRQNDFAQTELRKALDAAEALVARKEEELTLPQVLAAQCASAGDAAAAAEFEHDARVAQRALADAQARLQEERSTGWPQRYANITARELAASERTYEALRVYTQARHGAQWVAKSKVPESVLSDDALRAEARAWNAGKAQAAR